MAQARGSSRAWRALATRQKARHLPCHWCGQPIDYTLVWPDPQSFSADHVRPWRNHPELRLDPGNVVSSHLLCNQVKGDSEHYTASLGSLSQVF